jgi:hypothetical protein
VDKSITLIPGHETASIKQPDSNKTTELIQILNLTLGLWKKEFFLIG